MELFDTEPDPEKNWLPYDGVVNYFGRIYDQAASKQLFHKLLTDVEWRPDQAVIFGKSISTKRMVSWYADESFEYRYSGTSKIALPWIAELQEIKRKVEQLTGEDFNSCLLNLYQTGGEGMAWHSDGEKYLKKEGAIASLSLGAERKFSFKHKKTKKRLDFWLKNGSLLVMKGTTQTHWLHRLPPVKNLKQPRINLTFRQIEPND